MPTGGRGEPTPAGMAAASLLAADGNDTYSGMYDAASASLNRPGGAVQQSKLEHLPQMVAGVMGNDPTVQTECTAAASNNNNNASQDDSSNRAADAAQASTANNSVSPNAKKLIFQQEVKDAEPKEIIEAMALPSDKSCFFAKGVQENTESGLVLLKEIKSGHVTLPDVEKRELLQRRWR